KYVVFLKIIFQVQTRGTTAEARRPKKGIVTESELTCKELTELITDYLEERLSAVNRIRFEEHLSACPTCAVYLDQMLATIAAIGSKPQLNIPAKMESTLLEAFRHWKNSQR